MAPAVNSTNRTRPTAFEQSLLRGPKAVAFVGGSRDRVPFPSGLTRNRLWKPLPLLALVFLLSIARLPADPPWRLDPETTITFSQLAIQDHKTLLNPDVDLLTDTRVWSFSRIETTLFTKEPATVPRHRGFLIYIRGPDGDMIRQKRQALEYPGLDSRSSARELQLLRFQATSSGNLPPAINPQLHRRR